MNKLRQSNNKPKFSNIFGNPTICAFELEHPHLMLNPRAIAVATATINTKSKEPIIAEFALILTPAINNKPEITSIHGNINAEKFNKISGNIL